MPSLLVLLVIVIFIPTFNQECSLGDETTIFKLLGNTSARLQAQAIYIMQVYHFTFDQKIMITYSIRTGIGGRRHGARSRFRGCAEPFCVLVLKAAQSQQQSGRLLLGGASMELEICAHRHLGLRRRRVSGRARLSLWSDVYVQSSLLLLFQLGTALFHTQEIA